MKVLSLFSGGGLGDYGLELAGMEIVGQVEIDDYCQKILKLRWPDVPKWRDIRGVKGNEVIEQTGAIDLVSGGFPCQPFSVAGNRRGNKDDRHLWPEMLRIISEVRPTWVVGENVPGIIDLALDNVLADLEGQGYETATIIFPAHALGPLHRRDRLWIISYPADTGIERVREWKESTAKNVADAFQHEKGSAHEPQKIGNQHDFRYHGNTMGHDLRNGCRFWSIEPNVGRVAHGVANRVDRLKLLGNGQVVQVVQWIGERIMEFDRHTPNTGGVIEI